VSVQKPHQTRILNDCRKLASGLSAIQNRLPQWRQSSAQALLLWKIKAGFYPLGQEHGKVCATEIRNIHPVVFIGEGLRQRTTSSAGVRLWPGGNLTPKGEVE
jgi:hypothetical protein